MKYKKIGDHGTWEESTIVVLEQIIRGDDTWTKLNLALREKISTKMISRNLYDPKYGLIARKVIRSEKGKLKVNYSNLESLVRVMEILVKDKEYYDIFTDWLYKAYGSDYGDLVFTGEAFSQSDDFEKWETVMKRTRGTYSLESAVSYIAMTMAYADQISKLDTTREIGNFIGWNLALDSMVEIGENARHKIVRQYFKRIYRNMVAKKLDLILDPEETNGYARVIKASEVGQIGHILSIIMFTDINKAMKAIDRILPILKEEGITVY